MIVYTSYLDNLCCFFIFSFGLFTLHVHIAGVRNLFYAWIALYDISILLYWVAVFVYSLYLI